MEVVYILKDHHKMTRGVFSSIEKAVDFAKKNLCDDLPPEEIQYSVVADETICLFWKWLGRDFEWSRFCRIYKYTIDEGE